MNEYGASHKCIFHCLLELIIQRSRFLELLFSIPAFNVFHQVKYFHLYQCGIPIQQGFLHVPAATESPCFISGHPLMKNRSFGGNGYFFSSTVFGTGSRCMLRFSSCCERLSYKCSMQPNSANLYLV